MTTLSTADIARRLAQRALDVCAHYLPNGHRNGRYWVVGDVMNTKGRSLFVRLSGPDYGKGAAGKWTDAATGEHGDLLDLIRLNRNFASVNEARSEALSFLALPPVDHPQRNAQKRPAPTNSPLAARRLFAASTPVPGTLADSYLRARGITCPLAFPALRFHPSCYLRRPDGTRSQRPALIAAVTDLAGNITGVHRTYLADDGRAKAPIEVPRRSLGALLGNAVRFGKPGAAMVVGEGLENVLSILSVYPRIPAAAALSVPHMAAFNLPPGLRCLYIALDNDAPGEFAAESLTATAEAAGVPVTLLRPATADWNEDLRTLAPDVYRNNLVRQIHPQDRLSHQRICEAASGPRRDEA